MRCLPLIFVVIFVSNSGCGIDLASLEHNNDPESVFELTFSQSVPSSVKNLKASEFGFRDNSTCYLRFDAPFSTIKQLTGNSFTIVASTDNNQTWIEDNISGERPVWWQPSISQSTKLYESATFHPSYFSGTALLIYDSTTNDTHLYWNGVD